MPWKFSTSPSFVLDAALFRLLLQNAITPVTPPPQLYRRIVVAANMGINDYETFGSDERGGASKRDERTLAPDVPQEVMYLEGRAGGEIRIEVRLTAALRTDGSILVSGNVKLFEGTSESTTDLDGEENFTVIVRPDSTTLHRVHIWNMYENEPGDYADIDFNFSNFAA